MPPVAFLALLTIALMLVAALRLELNFRRSAEGSAPEPCGPRPEPRRSRPELRSAPAGGYCQSPWPVAALRGAA